MPGNHFQKASSQYLKTLTFAFTHFLKGYKKELTQDSQPRKGSKMLSSSEHTRFAPGNEYTRHSCGYSPSNIPGTMDDMGHRPTEQ